ncbi:MAG: glycosyltransferase family 2 protein [Actinoplanes sp.]
MTVVIPTHSEKRWNSLVRTVTSVAEQSLRPVETIVVVDHNPAMFRRVQDELPHVTVLENRYDRGASGNRNTGAEHARTEFVAFLDDDTAACANFMERMMAPFTDPRVVGAGSGIDGEWEITRPRWMPDEFLWTVGISYAGMPTDTAPIRNVWSASMVVRREAFAAVGGFRNGFGKLGDQNRPEDTDLCLRMSAVDGGIWMYVPGAVIRHEVPADRSTFKFFLNRCYHEGRGKVQMADLGDGDLGTEKDYLRKTLPRAVGKGLVQTGKGKGVAHAMRSGAMVAAVFAAGFGVVAESLTGMRSRPAAVASATPADTTS